MQLGKGLTTPLWTSGAFVSDCDIPTHPLKKRSPFLISEDYFDASLFTLLHADVERPTEAPQDKGVIHL